jgi:microcystin-dependent protein
MSDKLLEIKEPYLKYVNEKIGAHDDRLKVVEGDLVGTTDEQTLINKTLTAPDINGGTVDGTVIGNTTPAAGTFTNMNATAVMQDGNLLLPTGTVLPFVSSTAPGGYLTCDGSAVSRTTYSALFAVVSTTFGSGDGSTTFNLPDLTNRFIYGGSSIGTTGGSATKTLSTNEIPAHTHTGTTDEDGSHTHGVTDPGHTHAHTSGYLIPGLHTGTSDGMDDTQNEPNVLNTPNAMSISSNTTGITVNSAGAHTHDFTTSSTGGGGSFSLLNPYMVMNYIIKV